MERHEAYRIAVEAGRSCIELLDEIVTDPPRKMTLIWKLESVQATLETACRDFGRGEAVETFDDLYLPLFDALGCVRSARQFCDRAGVMTYLRGVIVELVERAIESLEEISSPHVAA